MAEPGNQARVDGDNYSRKHATEVDVIIVGAGLSGLSAAYKISEKDPGIRFVVLEAKDRVGGRTLGQRLKAATGEDTWDMGGQWVGSCQKQVMELLKELGLETYRQFTTGGKLVQLSNNKISRYESDIPSLSFLALIDLHLFIRKFESMCKEINVSDPGLSRHAAEWDLMTVEQFKNEQLWTTGAKDVFDAALRCIFGADPLHMSLLYCLTYMACAGGLDPIISTKVNTGGQEFKIKGGAWQICSTLANKIGKSRVVLSSPVSSIYQDEVHVVATTSSGAIYNGMQLILALPPNMAGRIEFRPCLPLDKLHVIQRMPIGYLTKVIVTYSKAFWRESGLSGEVVTSGGVSVVEGCDRGPLCLVFDATLSTGNPAIVSFIGGDQQLQYSQLTSSERKRAVLHSLAELFGPNALSPLDYAEKNWNEEPFNGGCPVCVGTPGMMTHLAAALRQPFRRVHFAGTESATSWCGFLNGAVQSGYRAAIEVLYNIRPQVVTATDLEGSIYDSSLVTKNKHRKPRSQHNHSLHMPWWSIGVLCLVTAGIVLVRTGRAPRIRSTNLHSITKFGL